MPASTSAGISASAPSASGASVSTRIGASACDQCTFCTYLCPRYLLGHPVEPHKAMRSLGFNLMGPANVMGSLFCCECNLCSMMACPEDLDPKNVMTQNKRALGQQKPPVKWDAPITEGRADMHLDNRRVPIARQAFWIA